jgi:hypothetical protein
MENITKILVVDDESQMPIYLDSLIAKNAHITYTHSKTIDDGLRTIEQETFQGILISPYTPRSRRNPIKRNLISDLENLLLKKTQWFEIQHHLNDKNRAKEYIRKWKKGEWTPPLGFLIAEKARQQNIPVTLFSRTYNDVNQDYQRCKSIHENQRIEAYPTNDEQNGTADDIYKEIAIKPAYFRLVRDICEIEFSKENPELKIIHSGCHLNDENYLKMAKAIKKMADKKYIFGEGNAFQLHGFSQGRRFDAQPNGGASAACDEYMILIGETPFRDGTYGRF